MQTSIQLTLLSRTRKGLENLFEIERVRDRERKIDYILHKGTETLVRDRESQLYKNFFETLRYTW